MLAEPGGREEGFEIDPKQESAKIVIQNPGNGMTRLRERAREDQKDRQREQGDRELERSERLEDRAQMFSQRRARSVRRFVVRFKIGGKEVGGHGYSDFCCHLNLTDAMNLSKF